MPQEAESMVLVYLRRLDEKVDRLIDDMRDLKIRVTNLVENFAKIELSIAGVNLRLDRVEARLDRIERRLDLVELPH